MSPIASPVTWYYTAIMDLLEVALSQHVGEEVTTVLPISYQSRAGTTAYECSDLTLPDLVTHWFSMSMLCKSNTQTTQVTWYSSKLI